MEVYTPKKILHPFVSMLYTLRCKKKQGEDFFNELSLPSGHCFLVFKNSGNFWFKIDDDDVALPDNYIVGQQTKYANIMSDNDYFEISVVALKPTALWHFFKLDISTLTNVAMVAEDLFNDKLINFKSRFFNIASAQEKLVHIENLLIDLLDVKKPNLNVVDTSIDIIQNAKGCISIKEIAIRLNISLRYFQKRFKQIVGISPSEYTRITRFNYIFAEFNKDASKNIKTLSAIFNYYDSAHFSKDFKRYCGISPTKFHLEKFDFLREIWIDDPMILKITK